MFNKYYKANIILITLLSFLVSTAHAGVTNSCDEELLASAKSRIDSYHGRTSKLETAYHELMSLLKDTPQCAPAYHELARIVERIGHPYGHTYTPGTLEKAEQLLKKAIDIDKNYADAYVTLSNVYIKMHRYDEAEKLASKARELGSNSPWLDIRMAQLAFHRKDYKEAARYYSKLIHSDRQNEYEAKRAISFAMERVIDIYIVTGDFDKADQGHRNLIARNGTAWEHGNYAHFLLYYTGNYDKAIQEAEKALEIMNYGSGRYFLAASLYRKWAELAVRKNDLNKAQPYFNRAYEIYPNLKKIYANALESTHTRLTAVALEKYYKVAMDNFFDHKKNKVLEHKSQTDEHI